MTERKRRAQPGRTYDPCHGCGGTDERPKTGICGRCDRERAAGRHAIAELARVNGDTLQPYRWHGV